MERANPFRERILRLLDPDPHLLLAITDSTYSFWVDGIVPAIALFILLMCSALASGSEAALFSLKPTDLARLETDEVAADSIILELLNGPRLILATLLILNNFVNVGIVILSNLLADHWLPNWGGWLDFVVRVIGITTLILFFGEILPKVYGTRKPLDFARTVAPFVRGAQRVLMPLSRLLIHSGNFLEGQRKRPAPQLSVGDLGQALELTQAPLEGQEEAKILRGIVRFGETSVRQILKPRTEIVAVTERASFGSVLDLIRSAGYSRIPVFREDLDDITGVLYIKDLLPYIDAADGFDWKQLIRPAFFVPEAKKIDDLLQEFRDRRIHMAIVVDEFGGTSGLVTLEDIIEEIVGDISDEFDDDELNYSKLDDNTYLFEGRVPLNDFCRVLALDPEEIEEFSAEADTLAGLILEVHGRFPEAGDQVVLGPMTFTIESVEHRRIQRVKVERVPDHAERS